MPSINQLPPFIRFRYEAAIKAGKTEQEALETLPPPWRFMLRRGPSQPATPNPPE